jgi:HD-GYP domain-containing protein (c-di-GMP phosphodiesterase class II)
MRLAELIGTLSLATDAGTGMPDETGLRVATVAARIGTLIAASPSDRASAFYISLLRFIGCTADSDTAARVFGDEVALGRETQGVDYGNPREMLSAVLRRARKGKGAIGGTLAMARMFGNLMGMADHAREHCEAADLLAARLGFDDSIRTALLQNNERWNGGGQPNKLRGEAIALPARIAQVAYDVELGHRFGGAEGIRTRLDRLNGTALDPTIVEQVTAAADDIANLLAVPSPWTAMLDAEPTPHREIAGDAVDEAIATMAAFADLKCKYTRNHSTGVAELAAAAARSIGLSPDIVVDVRRAGLLHDLGRVAVSAGIWDKAAPLTDLEREQVRMHTYVGERVLARAPSLARVAEIACAAHERLDATGYHRRLSAAQCSPAARILAAADVYHALIEDRPHRPAFTAAAAAAEITEMAEAGTLCPDATRAVLGAAGHVPPKVDRVAGLTERQVEVLRLLARGLTNKEIASALDISTKTAGHHVQHIFEKLRVTTRSAAAICAMRYGILA